MRAILASLALIGVAACQTDVSDAQAVPAQTVPVAFGAGPGERAVNMQLGIDVVNAACVQTRPRFKQTPDVLAAMGGFVQNAQTLTYYHQSYDMSVKLIDGRCSVVIGGLKTADEILAVRTQAGPLGVVSISRPSKDNGRIYVAFSVREG